MVKGQKKTRKNTSKKSMLTIPQLRKAFDHMDKVVEGLRNTSKHSFSDAVSKYREEWYKTFKRELSPADAATYLKFRYGIKSGKTRRGPRTRTRGGAVMGTSGAPLDYQLRAGVNGVYGNFPTYQTQGLDRYYASAITSDCGKPNGFSTDGSAASQAGGGMLDGLFRPFAATAVPTSPYVAMMTDPGKGTTHYPPPTTDGMPPVRTVGVAYVPPQNISEHIRAIGTDIHNPKITY